MGACLGADRVKPQEEMDPEEFVGPVKARSCTDVFMIIVMLFFTIVLFVLVGHCIISGNIYRVLYGYDSCGNVCGRVTPKEKDPTFACKGANFTQKKYLLIKEAGRNIVNPRNVHKECVSDCSVYPGYMKFLRRCIPEKSAEVVNNFFSTTGLKDFFLEVAEDLHVAWTQLIYLCLLASVSSLMVLFLLQFVAGLVVWFVLIATVVVSVVATIYLWIVWNTKQTEEQTSDISKRIASTYLAYAIIATVITVIVFLIILVMRKRIQLVVELFKEAGKAVSSMPLLILQPFFTFGSLLGVMSLWIYFSVWIESSGHLNDGSPSFYYKKDTTMKVARWYNLFAVFWMTQFCIACQHLVISGSVVDWYFTRNKENLESPIVGSFWRLIRYHLGSAALGSLLVGFVQYIRAVLSILQSQVKEAQNDIVRAIFRACQCCLYCFENFLKYINRNAYIEIAIYGKNFCTSGGQAFSILTNNAMRVFAINSVGDFVLFLSKVFVVSLTLLVGSIVIEKIEGIHHMWVLLSLVGIFAYFVSHCFITVYEMVIDTIFICFCEDCIINDGISKPYYMSTGLMTFVQNSKKVLAHKSARSRPTSETKT